MKVTRDYLKQIIRESLEEVSQKDLERQFPSLKVNVDDGIKTYVEAVDPKKIGQEIKKSGSLQAFMDNRGKIFHGGKDIGGSDEYVPPNATPVKISYKTVVVVQKVSK